MAQRLAVIEGSSQLTVAQVRAHALQAMHRHQATRCLVVVDYLQLWAKVAEDLRGTFQVRERVDLLGGLLRELALQPPQPGTRAVVAEPRRRAITAMAKAQRRWIPSRNPAIWSMRPMPCCSSSKLRSARSSPSAGGRSRGRQEPAR